MRIDRRGKRKRALVRFAALYGIIISDIGGGGNTLAAADLESA